MTTSALTPEQAVFVLIDVQGKLAARMHERETLFDYLRRFVAGVRRLGLPVLWLEQYPEGLGPTVPEIAALLSDLRPMRKLSFSAWGCPEFRDALVATARRQVLLAGIEAHVCVYQTARDLLAAGYAVEVVSDAVSSRTAANRELGLARMRAMGARLTSVEMALFEMLGSAQVPAFKDIARLVK